jgi:hypothetical protein
MNTIINAALLIMSLSMAVFLSWLIMLILSYDQQLSFVMSAYLAFNINRKNLGIQPKSIKNCFSE